MKIYLFNNVSQLVLEQKMSLAVFLAKILTIIYFRFLDHVMKTQAFKFCETKCTLNIHHKYLRAATP